MNSNMDTFTGKIIMIIMVVFLSFDVLAQEPITENLDVKLLNDEQRGLLKEQKEILNANRETFKASLTDEQKSILHNDELSREQKRNALRSTLSIEQKTILKNNKQAFHQNRNQFRNSLSEDQKMKMRNKMQKKRENIKRVVRRTRLTNIRD